MHITIDVHHHFEPERVSRAELHEILTHVRALRTQGDRIMSKLSELEDELVEINTTTNEMAVDIDDLIAKLADQGLTEAERLAVKAELVSLKAKLQAIAAKHTPTPPAP